MHFLESEDPQDLPVAATIGEQRADALFVVEKYRAPPRRPLGRGLFRVILAGRLRRPGAIRFNHVSSKNFSTDGL